MEKQLYDAKMERLVAEVSRNANSGMNHSAQLLQSVRNMVEFMLSENGLPVNIGAVLHLSYQMFVLIGSSREKLVYSEGVVSFETMSIKLQVGIYEADPKGDYYEKMRRLSCVYENHDYYRGAFFNTVFAINSDGSIIGEANASIQYPNPKNLRCHLHFLDNGLPGDCKLKMIGNSINDFPYNVGQVIHDEYNSSFKKRSYSLECNLADGTEKKVLLDTKDIGYQNDYDAFLFDIPGLTYDIGMEYIRHYDAIYEVFPELCDVAKERKTQKRAGRR